MAREDELRINTEESTGEVCEIPDLNRLHLKHPERVTRFLLFTLSVLDALDGGDEDTEFADPFAEALGDAAFEIPLVLAPEEDDLYERVFTRLHEKIRNGIIS